VTVRKAINGLVKAGLVAHRVGSGTFVSNPGSRDRSVPVSFSHLMAARGLRVGTIWLERTLGTASAPEARTLGIAPDTQVARLVRVRTADGRPIVVQRTTLPFEFLPDPASVGASLYATLQARKILPMRVRHRISARLALPECEEWLELGKSDAVLQVERHAFLANDRMVEMTISAFRADAYDVLVDHELHGTPG